MQFLMQLHLVMLDLARGHTLTPPIHYLCNFLYTHALHPNALVCSLLHKLTQTQQHTHTHTHTHIHTHAHTHPHTHTHNYAHPCLQLHVLPHCQRLGWRPRRALRHGKAYCVFLMHNQERWSFFFFISSMLMTWWSTCWWLNYTIRCLFLRCEVLWGILRERTAPCSCVCRTLPLAYI